MTDNWKDKYLSKLEQLDKKQKEWSGLEEFLRQTISRLALAAEGNSKLLDDKLRVLRKAIRQGESKGKLTMIMDGVATELVRLDKLKANKPKGNAGFLETLVNALSLTKDMEKKSRPLRKLFKAKNPPEDEVLVKEFSVFFGHCLKFSYNNGMDSDKGQKKQGFFDRLFSSSDDSSENNNNKKISTEKESDINHQGVSDNQGADSDNLKYKYEPVSGQQPVLEQLSEDNRLKIEQSVTESLHNILDSFIESLDYPQEQKTLLREKLFSIKPTKEIHVLLGDLAHMIRDAEIHTDNQQGEGSKAVTTEAHEILIRLLESIPMQEGILERAEKLKKNFSRGISQSELPAALEAIAKLISRMQKEASRDSRKFEEFLLNMTGKLKEFDEFLAADLDEHKDSWEKGMALGNTVKEQVQEIGNSVSEATDLKLLEKTIQNRLDKIINKVEEHRQVENIRVKRIQQQNKTLQNKIKQLETESSDLKDKIVNSYEKAHTDPLTNLPNRLSYEKHLEEHFARWERYHENLLLMIWDIDYFKKVNDTYGHQAGDEVLKAVAKLLRTHLRKPDFIGRFGGEEFVSLLPNTSLGGGYKVAEKMRTAVSEMDFKYKDQAIPLTISCGISLFASNDQPDDVFARADKALYQAKEQGRNRCVIAQD